VTEASPASETERTQAADPQQAVRHAAPVPEARRNSDFGDLARRLSTWTTNLLAIGILAVAALAMAGRLTEWWRTDPAAPVVDALSLPPAPWDDPAGIVLEFGDQPWSIRRQALTGSVDDASHALLELCRGILNEVASTDSLPAIDASEQTLLDRLRNTAPEEEVPNRWRLYVVRGPLPWIVGTTTAPHTSSTAAQRDVGPHDAGATDRLLCWGLALPQPEQGWTLYVFDRRSSDARGGDLPEVPLPSGARRSLRVGGSGRNALTTFSGASPATQWMAEFDDALTSGGWRRLGDWNRGGTSHAAAYVREDKSDSVRLEITLTQGPDGRWLGVAETQRLPAGPTTESDAP
jgi:hypothetical protein